LDRRFPQSALGNPVRTSYRAGLIDPITDCLVLRHADAVIANTDALAAMLVSRYPELSEKISIIWAGLDPKDHILARSWIIHACVDLAADADHLDADILAFLRRPLADMRPSAQFWSEFDGSRQTAALSVLIDQVYDKAVRIRAEPVAYAAAT
jgi:hypothetical protein